MRNLGMALGNAASSAQSSFANALKLQREIDDLRFRDEVGAFAREREESDRTERAPQAINAEFLQRTFGMSPEDAATRAGELQGLPVRDVQTRLRGFAQPPAPQGEGAAPAAPRAALPQFRVVQNQDGSFSAVPAGPSGRDEASDLRRLASIYGRFGRAEDFMRVSREAGDREVMQRMGGILQAGSSWESLTAHLRDSVPDGVTPTVTRIATGPNQGMTEFRYGQYSVTANSPQEAAAQIAISMSRNPEAVINYLSTLGAREDARRNSFQTNETTRRGQDMTYSVGMAGVRQRADEVAANADWRRAQTAALTAQSDQIRAAIQNDTQLTERYNEFERLLTEDPTGPRVRQLAQRLFAQGGNRFVGQDERTETTQDGQVRVLRSEYNRLERMIERAQPRAADGAALSRVRDAYRGANAEERTQIRRQYDEQYGRGAANRDLGRDGETPAWLRATPTQVAPAGPNAPARSSGIPTPRPVSPPSSLNLEGGSSLTSEQLGERLSAARTALREHRNQAPSMQERPTNPQAVERWRVRERELQQAVSELEQAFRASPGNPALAFPAPPR